MAFKLQMGQLSAWKVIGNAEQTLGFPSNQTNMRVQSRYPASHRPRKHPRRLLAMLMLLHLWPVATFAEDVGALVLPPQFVGSYTVPPIPMPVAIKALSSPSLYTTKVSLGLPFATPVEAVSITGL